jgi:N utilization substance protein B
VSGGAEAREAALGALYEAEQRGATPETDGLGVRAAAIVEGVWAQREALDAAIGEVSHRWRPERMPPVDLTVLRIALWELRSTPDTPLAVVISEAVRLVKEFSTESSGRFVNGVLARLAETERSAPA